MKRKKQAGFDAGSEMLATVLAQGGAPAIMIGMKPGDMPGRVDYFVVSKLAPGEIRHVLSRLARLFDGNIAESN